MRSKYRKFQLPIANRSAIDRQQHSAIEKEKGEVCQKRKHGDEQFEVHEESFTGEKEVIEESITEEEESATLGSNHLDEEGGEVQPPSSPFATTDVNGVEGIFSPRSVAAIALSSIYRQAAVAASTSSNNVTSTATMTCTTTTTDSTGPPPRPSPSMQRFMFGTAQAETDPQEEEKQQQQQQQQHQEDKRKDQNTKIIHHNSRSETKNDETQVLPAAQQLQSLSQPQLSCCSSRPGSNDASPISETTFPHENHQQHQHKTGHWTLPICPTPSPPLTKSPGQNAVGPQLLSASSYNTRIVPATPAVARSESVGNTTASHCFPSMHYFHGGTSNSNVAPVNNSGNYHHQHFHSQQQHPPPQIQQIPPPPHMQWWRTMNPSDHSHFLSYSNGHHHHHQTSGYPPPSQQRQQLPPPPPLTVPFGAVPSFPQQQQPIPPPPQQQHSSIHRHQSPQGQHNMPGPTRSPGQIVHALSWNDSNPTTVEQTQMSTFRSQETTQAPLSSSTTCPLKRQKTALTTHDGELPISNTNLENYSRKKKSLGVLAETFLAKHRHSPQGTVAVIDLLAEELGVERRRIYDVVNIFESVKLVVKRGKNTYHWMGTDHLPRYFAILQREACLEHPQDAIAAGLISQESASTVASRKGRDNATHKRQSKSLSRLSQQFLQVFLVGNPVVSLADASDKIHGTVTSLKELATLGARGMPCSTSTSNATSKSGDSPSVSTMDLPKDPELLQRLAARGLKTKIRRLYDIANVLSATGYLAKVDDPPAPTTTPAHGHTNNQIGCSGTAASSIDPFSSFGYHRRPYYKWVYHLNFAQIRHIGQTIPTDQTCPFTVNNSNARKDSITPPFSACHQHHHNGKHQQFQNQQRILRQLHPAPNYQATRWNPILPRMDGNCAVGPGRGHVYLNTTTEFGACGEYVPPLVTAVSWAECPANSKNEDEPFWNTNDGVFSTTSTTNAGRDTNDRPRSHLNPRLEPSQFVLSSQEDGGDHDMVIDQRNRTTSGRPESFAKDSHFTASCETANV
ncbi:hypothetical protein ACA910_019122 [Epithemia clementina (nom. ined.)]